MEKEWIEKHIDDMVQDICKLSEIPSVSVKTEDPDMPFGQACLDALHAALDLGKSMGFETFNHENYCGTLLWKGEVIQRSGFFGHADVVPAGNGWTCCEPFKPVVKDGLLIGRGVSDNKGSFMTALYALKYLKEQGYKQNTASAFSLDVTRKREWPMCSIMRRIIKSRHFLLFRTLCSLYATVRKEFWNLMLPVR